PRISLYVPGPADRFVVAEEAGLFGDEPVRAGTEDSLSECRRDRRQDVLKSFEQPATGLHVETDRYDPDRTSRAQRSDVEVFRSDSLRKTAPTAQGFRGEKAVHGQLRQLARKDELVLFRGRLLDPLRSGEISRNLEIRD